ncbi:glycerol-3-phosphate responsive antiterminator [Jeotgalibacillus salarius]|uniref:Glycerol uptake operon antiterminator regulatory protein n=1 Tax=Jeotgalibacillus salarius TaxID=546023 RepID=A0A4Y8L4D3_9BACL|nr:glycerol-3-phosphate responsive antiterminator [Jeotgalibacillus salarius]TFD97121.1 glycerol-3-phosphate responsive antiterminator [Jeotgalibacillus salarius]
MLKDVIPAVRSMKDFEHAIENDHEYIILLETRLSQVESVVKYAKQHQKKVFMHADLVQGLKVDEYGLEYLIHNVKVDGIISTRGNVIAIAKKNNIIGIQRLFALDSYALDHNLEACKKIKPDYIEVLPGIMPGILKEITDETGIPLIAGGLIRTREDVNNSLNNGALAVTTSNRELW